MKRSLLVPLAALAFTANAQGQHQPYAGEHGRSIKALSEQEIQQYDAGAGMGYAKAAELNHFPGPMHVLELTDKLDLSAEQRAAAQQLMVNHKAEARAIGVRKVAAERELDMLFRSGNVDERRLAEAVRTAATIDGEYRLSHLEAHRRLRAVLSDSQVRRYDELRGYGDREHKH